MPERCSRKRSLGNPVSTAQVYQEAEYSAQDARQEAVRGNCEMALQLYERALIGFGAARARGGSEERRQSTQYAIQDARTALRRCLRRRK